MPASFQRAMYLPGLPAPVVRKRTPSSTTISAISSAQGFMSIRLTPKGLSVSVLHLRISARSCSVFMPPQPIRPMAPALEQAAANSAVAMLAMPPWMIGNSIPSSSLSFFIYEMPPISIRQPPQVRPPPKPTQRTFMPLRSRPASYSSLRATGMQADDMLP